MFYIAEFGFSGKEYGFEGANRRSLEDSDLINLLMAG